MNTFTWNAERREQIKSQQFTPNFRMSGLKFRFFWFDLEKVLGFKNFKKFNGKMLGILFLPFSFLSSKIHMIKGKLSGSAHEIARFEVYLKLATFAEFTIKSVPRIFYSTSSYLLLIQFDNDDNACSIEPTFWRSHFSCIHLHDKRRRWWIWVHWRGTRWMCCRTRCGISMRL